MSQISLSEVEINSESGFRNAHSSYRNNTHWNWNWRIETANVYNGEHFEIKLSVITRVTENSK